jgi:type IV pilus assembly protein PilA
MKNIKIDLKKTAKAGFSLVEMLVVIAIIGIIAAIAIPNIGNINSSAKVATAQRNAQQIASIYNAAVVAGYAATPASVAAAVTAIATEAGVTIPDDGGPFAGKKFTVGAMSAADQAAAVKYLRLQDGNLAYTKTAAAAAAT